MKRSFPFRSFQDYAKTKTIQKLLANHSWRRSGAEGKRFNGVSSQVGFGRSGGVWGKGSGTEGLPWEEPLEDEEGPLRLANGEQMAGVSDREDGQILELLSPSSRLAKGSRSRGEVWELEGRKGGWVGENWVHLVIIIPNVIRADCCLVQINDVFSGDCEWDHNVSISTGIWAKIWPHYNKKITSVLKGPM